MKIDYFVIYDLESGEPQRIGQVPAGQAALQRASLGPTEDLMLVPAEAMMGMSFDAEPVRKHLLGELEASLGAAIGFHPARDYLYLQKETAARAVLEGSGSGDLLSAEAEVRGLSVAELAQAIVDAAEARRERLGEFEAQRAAIKAKLVDAANIGTLATIQREIAALARAA